MYSMELLPKARKELLHLPRGHRRRIEVAIDLLCENPFAGKKLKGDFHGTWALRVWPYRVIYTFDREIVRVTVIRIGHRQGVYK